MPGVYVLILEIEKHIDVDVGSLGRIEFEKSLLGYVGSARGFGGIKSRVEHHKRKNKKKLWWHIDYLTNVDEVILKNVICAKTTIDFEYSIAKAFENSRCWGVAIPGFGSSDKKSVSHLFRCLCSMNECIEEVTRIFLFLNLDPCIYSFND